MRSISVSVSSPHGLLGCLIRFLIQSTHSLPQFWFLASDCYTEKQSKKTVSKIKPAGGGLAMSMEISAALVIHKIDDLHNTDNKPNNGPCHTNSIDFTFSVPGMRNATYAPLLSIFYHCVRDSSPWIQTVYFQYLDNLKSLNILRYKCRCILKY